MSAAPPCLLLGRSSRGEELLLQYLLPPFSVVPPFFFPAAKSWSTLASWPSEQPPPPGFITVVVAVTDFMAFLREFAASPKTLLFFTHYTDLHKPTKFPSQAKMAPRGNHALSHCSWPQTPPSQRAARTLPATAQVPKSDFAKQLLSNLSPASTDDYFSTRENKTSYVAESL